MHRRQVERGDGDVGVLELGQTAKLGLDRFRCNALGKLADRRELGAASEHRKRGVGQIPAQIEQPAGDRRHQSDAVGTEDGDQRRGNHTTTFRHPFRATMIKEFSAETNACWAEV